MVIARGTGTWSEHAYGRAIDINPVENPYVRGGTVDPPAGRQHLDRTAATPGLIRDGDAVVQAFVATGWSWGGHWDRPWTSSTSPPPAAERGERRHVPRCYVPDLPLEGGAMRLRVITATALLCAMFLLGASPAAAAPGDGYWMLGSDGVVYAFGAAPHCGHAESIFLPSSYGADIEPFPNGRGYWVLDGENFVDFIYCDSDAFGYGYETNNFFSERLVGEERPVSMSALPDGSGYWVFTNQGRVLAFGDAQFYGDMGGKPLNGPILDSVATPSGKGYWMVASDGGIFAFGDAAFSGSMGGATLNQPVMSMAPDPDGRGYWLVASDGGIFAFDAPFYGSMGSTPLNQPVSGIVASPTGRGYLMVALDGGAFTFGDVPFHGSLGGSPPAFPVTAIAVRR